MEYVSGVADRTPAAQNITSRFTRSRTFSPEAQRPFALEITGGLCGAKLDGFGGDFVDVPADWLRRFRLFGHAGSFGRRADCIQLRWAPASVADYFLAFATRPRTMQTRKGGKAA
jgi:hypothetical protein